MRSTWDCGFSPSASLLLPPSPSCMRVPGGWGLGTLEWAQHSCSSAGQGGSALKACSVLVYLGADLLCVSDCPLWGAGLWVHEFLPSSACGSTALSRSVPHPLLHDLVHAQMPVLYVLVLCAYMCIQVCSECARVCAYMRVLGVHLHTCISVYASVPDPLCWQVYMKATLRGRQYTCVCAHLYFCVCDPSPLASSGRKTGRM